MLLLVDLFQIGPAVNLIATILCITEHARTDILDAYWAQFYVHGSVHRESMSIIVQQGATI